ncbi:MAG: anti-sigma factor family protein [Bryobacteraceae bacterium]
MNGFKLYSISCVRDRRSSKAFMLTLLAAICFMCSTVPANPRPPAPAQSLPHHNEMRSFLMSRKQKSMEREFRYARTTTPCDDPGTGNLLPGYLIDDLSPANRKAVEEHLESCAYCRIGVSNWRVTLSAVRHFGVPGAKRAPLRSKL